MTHSASHVDPRKTAPGARIGKMRAVLARNLLRALPVPGRHLDISLRLMGVEPSQVDVPALCSDRWRQFSVSIRNPNDVIERHIFFQGYFEWKETQFVKRCLEGGDIFFDVGANIGWYTLLAASIVKSKGQVFSFEPLTGSYDRLVENCRLNAFDHVRAFNVAIGRTAGRASIFDTEQSVGGASLFPGKPHPTKGHHVTVAALDEVIDEHKISRAKLCKIDIEGSEIDALDGMRDAMKRKLFAYILIEANDSTLKRAGHDVRELLGRLRTAGYTVRDVRSPNAIIGAAASLPPFGNYICAA